MRLSIRKGDPGYNLALAMRAKVLVDGIEMEHCFTADEELGVAFCYDTNDDGVLFLTEDGDSIAEIEVKGVVKIVVGGS